MLRLLKSIAPVGVRAFAAAPVHGIKALNHVAIVVPNLDIAMKAYKKLGVAVGLKKILPDFGVTVAMMRLENISIELVHPLGTEGSFHRFLEKHPRGGMHHICFEVDDLEATVGLVDTIGMRFLDRTPKLSDHGFPVLYLDPSTTCGVLTEISEVNSHIFKKPRNDVPGIKAMDHVAVVVPNMDIAVKAYRDLGCHVEPPKVLPKDGVHVAVVKLANTNLELVYPTEEEGAFKRFLAKHPRGGLHHICYDCEDLTATLEIVDKIGMRCIDRTPKINDHGYPVVYLEPKDACGVLTEMTEME